MSATLFVLMVHPLEKAETKSSLFRKEVWPLGLDLEEAAITTGQAVKMQTAGDSFENLVTQGGKHDRPDCTGHSPRLDCVWRDC